MCEPDAPMNYISMYLRCIDQERDYQNKPKAFKRDVLRFEIALEGVKFIRSLEYTSRGMPPSNGSVSALTLPFPTLPSPPPPPRPSPRSHPRPSTSRTIEPAAPAEAAASRGGFFTASAGVLLAAASAGSRFC